MMFGLLDSKFKDSDTQEIELELVVDTVSEALLKQQLENTAFHKGYHHGYKEGWHARQKDEDRKNTKFCLCGCGGNNCHLRFCDENCRLYNI